MANGACSARTLSDEKARSLVEAWRRGVPEKALDRDCPVIDAGTTGWDPCRVDVACTRVLDFLAELKRGGVKVDAFNFDRVACARVHKEMQLPPTVAASDGFWRWLAVTKLPAVIEARHGNLDKGIYAHLGNYGIGTNIRNRLRILWLRANMLYDANAPDPYRLAKRFLHSDFIESGIIRHRYGWCRNLARVLVRFQYRHPKSKEVYLLSTGSRSIRELYKRLRHLHSVYAFEFMSDQELWALLEKHSQDLRRAR